ncbi:MULTISPECIES: sirohydrochlorin chelatase [unclassified Streptomyces]|uniref:sirohydrochlorin chelatase n=1 Tax=unclassified Streptomyces TaxID=2593676 RepID=UPI0038203D2A
MYGKQVSPVPSAAPVPSGAPVLVVVAHGSRDPRHAATVHALVRAARALRPGLRVETGFLDFNVPAVPALLESLAAEGVREVVVLPLLLTRAFHAKADLPAVLRAAPPRLRVRQAEVLGPSPLLLAALERRLREAGVTAAERSSTGIVLASAGSSDPEAVAVIEGVARAWRRAGGWREVLPAYASAALPRTEDAVRALRARGCARVAVAPYVLAPGFLPDRIARGAADADVLAGVLGAAPEVARLLLERHDAARSPLAAALGA